MDMVFLCRIGGSAVPDTLNEEIDCLRRLLRNGSEQRHITLDRCDCISKRVAQDSGKCNKMPSNVVPPLPEFLEEERNAHRTDVAWKMHKVFLGRRQEWCNVFHNTHESSGNETDTGSHIDFQVRGKVRKSC